MTVLCSVYRLKVDELDRAVKPSFEGEVLQIDVAGRPGIWVDRGFPAHPPDWAPALSAMTGHSFDNTTQSAGSLAVIDVGDATYAVAFGTGWHLLDESAYVRDFGIAVAIRCLDPERVAEVTRSALGLTNRHDLTQIPAGGHVRAFAIEQYAEIVKEIGGRSNTLDVAYLRGRPRGVQLDGRHALRVRVPSHSP